MGSETFEPVDVVVVAAGNAAACAALAAREQGASALMVEAAPQSQSGGNTRYTARAMRVVFDGAADLVQLMPDRAEHAHPCRLHENTLIRCRTSRLTATHPQPNHHVANALHAMLDL